MKKIIFFLLALSVLAIIGCSSNKSVTATMPNLNSIPDGVYRGSYSMSGTPVKATVDVTVRSHRITAIEIVQHNSSARGKNGEAIIDSIIQHQRLDVDVISGATGSSKTLLKAVENALQ